jgi:hypothetical protein
MISIRTQGRMETDTTLNPGDPVYLAETDGAVTSTIPVDAGDYIQVVGQAESASVFVINIYPRAVVI